MLNRKVPKNPNLQIDYTKINKKRIWLAGGCFWGVEAFMKRVYGVAGVKVGYLNSEVPDPSYELVCSGTTGAFEAAEVEYDINRISLFELLTQFFRIIDPTVDYGQGNDVGTQYRTGIFYENKEDLIEIRRAVEVEQGYHRMKVLTIVDTLKNFYPAEEYHQAYLDKNPNGYCHVDLMKLLTPEQIRVTQKNGTEMPFQNEFWNHFQRGIYVDVVSGIPLFSSRDKFESSCGWPSFSKPIEEEVLSFLKDESHGMTRIEVRSLAANSHLGHVFDDGPVEFGGRRFCINSAALRFIPESRMNLEGYGEWLEML